MPALAHSISMPPRLFLLAAALLPAAAATPSVPPAVLCSDGECDADGSVNLLQSASAQQVAKESLAADMHGKRHAAAKASAQTPKQESNATQAAAEGRRQESNATRAAAEDRPPMKESNATRAAAEDRGQESNATQVGVERRDWRRSPEAELLKMNLTFANLLSQQIDIELDYSDASSIPTKNKVGLAIIELFGLGLCGVDRCYVGQTALGIVKGMTLGGLVLWAFVDYLVVIITCLTMSPDLNGMGMRAHFDKTSVMPAFVIALVFLIVKIMCGHHHAQKRRLQSTSHEHMAWKEDRAAVPVFKGSG